MANPIIISCDSACDVSPALQQQYGIQITHMYVHEGNRKFQDGIDITPEDIYRIYETESILPQTSAIPPAEYTEFFSRFVEQGYDVIHIAFTSGLSCTCQNAMLAAQSFDNVYVLDSLALSCGGALLVLQACRMRDAGMDAKAICQSITRQIPAIKTSFIVSDLTFLAKGGRCSSVAAFGANLLNIRPAIEMENGKLFVGKKYRGHSDVCYEKFLLDKLEEARQRSDCGIAYLYHAGIDTEIFQHLVDIATSANVFQEILTSRAGSIISSHCGRNTIGFSYQKALD